MPAVTSPRLRLALAIGAFLPACAFAQTVYINETFETDTIGLAPDDSAQRRVLQVTTAAGPVAMGTDQLAHYNDTSTSGGGSLEYNVGTSALTTLYTSFDLFNNAPVEEGSAANPIIFGYGNWNDSTSTLLSANANRAFGVEIYQVGASSTVRIRVGGSAVLTGTYTMSAVQHLDIWLNDHDTNAFDYIVPGTSITATLGANSAVVYINNTLVGAGLDSGFVMSTGAGSGNTTGNATLGRLGFNSSSTNTPNFLIDNLYVTDGVVIPEPSTYAALAGVGVLGLAALRRRRRAA